MDINKCKGNKIGKIVKLAEAGKLLEVHRHIAGIKNIKILLEISCIFGQNDYNDLLIIVCDRILQLNPNSAAAWSNKGVALNNLGRYEEALECYNKSLTLNPQNWIIYYNKSVSLSYLDRHDEAIECLDILIEKYEKIDRSGSENDNNKLLELKNNLAIAFGRKSYILYELEKYKEAIVCCERAITEIEAFANLDLGDQQGKIIVQLRIAELLLNKAIYLLKQKKYDESIACSDKAIDIFKPLHIKYQYIEYQYKKITVKNDLIIALSNKSATLIESGRYKEAVDCTEELLELDEHLAEGYGNLGCAFLNLHEYEKAKINFKKAKDLFAENGFKEDSDKAQDQELWSENSQILLEKMKPIDQFFMECLNSPTLGELKEKSQNLYEEVKDLQENINEMKLPTDVRELIDSKVICFSSLSKALSFKYFDINDLEKAKLVYNRWNLKNLFYATNCIENFIVMLGSYNSIAEISPQRQEILLLSLNHAVELNGISTGNIISRIKINPYIKLKEGKNRDPVMKYEVISQTQKEWVRFCLVQVSFTLDKISRSNGFGYVLEEIEHNKKKIFDALNIALEEGADVVCYPELSTMPEWIRDLNYVKKINEDLIIIFGSFYKDNFNVCPVIIGEKHYSICKINPAPGFETEVVSGKFMKKGDQIYVFQTKCGRFAVLICMDYKEEVHRILHSSNSEIKNVDFIIIPEYNRNIELFQEQANLDCQKGSYPFIIQINSLKVFNEIIGGTCIVGMEHNSELERYALEGLKHKKDKVKYKLFETKEECIVIVDLDLNRKGVPIPPTGPKLKLINQYTFRRGKWEHKLI